MNRYEVMVTRTFRAVSADDPAGGVGAGHAGVTGQVGAGLSLLRAPPPVPGEPRGAGRAAVPRTRVGAPHPAETGPLVAGGGRPPAGHPVPAVTGGAGPAAEPPGCVRAGDAAVTRLVGAGRAPAAEAVASRPGPVSGVPRGTGETTEAGVGVDAADAGVAGMVGARRLSTGGEREIQSVTQSVVSISSCVTVMASAHHHSNVYLFNLFLLYDLFRATKYGPRI